MSSNLPQNAPNCTHLHRHFQKFSGDITATPSTSAEAKLSPLLSERAHRPTFSELLWPLPLGYNDNVSLPDADIGRSLKSFMVTKICL